MDAISSPHSEPQGIPAGLYWGAIGLSSEVPFVREMTEMNKAFNPYESGQFWGELGKSMVVPQAVDWAARQMDKDAQGKVIPRKPATAAQYFEESIPGLRQDVPKAKLKP